MTLVIGHKGAPILGPENTVASFARARSLGIDGVELDVRRTGDDQLAVWHDPALADGRVLLDHRWDQLDGGVDGLEEVLDACRGLDVVNVEIKNWPTDPDFDPDLGIADTVAATLAGRSPAERESFVVSCFHLGTVDRVRERLDVLAPEIRTGLLLWGVDDVTDVVTTVVERRHGALHPHFTAVTAELLAEAHAAKLAVNTWTCNHLEDIRRLADLGTDGIITDRPDEAKAALAG
ncbi:MAG: glycerophosphodiester phosphodiesterase [Acidimicrobiales bacterium]